MTKEEFVEKWGWKFEGVDLSTELLADLDSLSLPPAEGAEAQRCPVCGGNGLVPNGFYNTVSGIWSTTSITPETCRSCNGTGLVFAAQQPTAEGAEEITAKEYLQNKYPQMRGHLWNSNEHINDDWIAEMMEGFATIHAQRIAEKMVEDRLREELIDFLSYCNASNIATFGKYVIDEYLKNRDIHD